MDLTKFVWYLKYWEAEILPPKTWGPNSTNAERIAETSIINVPCPLIQLMNCIHQRHSFQRKALATGTHLGEIMKRPQLGTVAQV